MSEEVEKAYNPDKTAAQFAHEVRVLEINELSVTAANLCHAFSHKYDFSVDEDYAKLATHGFKLAEALMAEKRDRLAKSNAKLERDLEKERKEEKK